VRRLGRSFGHVIRCHIESGTEGGGYVSEFDVLAKHVHAHVDVSSSGLVCWVKAHGNRPFVVHIDVGGTRITKTKVLKEYAEIESFLGSLRSRDVLAFWRAWERSAAEFYMGIVRAVNNAEVLGLDHIASHAQVRIEVFLRGIVHIQPEHGDAVCEVGACQDCHVNELAVSPQNALFDFCINDGWTICLAEQNIRVERRTYTGRGERIKPHRADEVVDMAPDFNAEHWFQVS